MFGSGRISRKKECRTKLVNAVPSLPYLVKIDTAMGVPKEGETISRVKVAGITGLDVESNAFINVLNQWRKRLFTCHGVVLTPDYRGSFIVATPAEKIKHAGKLKRIATTYASQSWAIASSADTARLTADDQVAQRALTANLGKAKLILAASIG